MVQMALLSRCPFSFSPQMNRIYFLRNKSRSASAKTCCFYFHNNSRLIHQASKFFFVDLQTLCKSRHHGVQVCTSRILRQFRLSHYHLILLLVLALKVIFVSLDLNIRYGLVSIPRFFSKFKERGLHLLFSISQVLLDCLSLTPFLSKAKLSLV